MGWDTADQVGVLLGSNLVVCGARSVQGYTSWSQLSRLDGSCENSFEEPFRWGLLEEASGETLGVPLGAEIIGFK